MNLPLKIAILATGQTQTEIAKTVRIDQTRLSKIIRQHVPATRPEKRRLSKVLSVPEADLFPPSAEAIAS